MLSVIISSLALHVMRDEDGLSPMIFMFFDSGSVLHDLRDHQENSDCFALATVSSNSHHPWHRFLLG